MAVRAPTLNESNSIIERLASAQARPRAYPRMVTGYWLGESGWDFLHRCWHFLTLKLELDGLIRIRCRGLLLMIFGLAMQPGVHFDQCQRWGELGFPTHSWKWDLSAFREHFRNVVAGSAFSPPLLRQPGGVFFSVGANTDAEAAEKILLPWRPQRIHLFEPVPDYCAQLREKWRRRYRNATVHCYGLHAQTQADMPLFLAGGSSSAYHQLHFSTRRMYLDTIGDRTWRETRDLLTVTMRAVVEVWRELGTNALALMHLNCEGCEYDVIPALARAGLLSRIEVVYVQTHLVLSKAEVDQQVSKGRCNPTTGSCALDASSPGLERYCSLMEVLGDTHRRVWGLPFNAHQLWERREKKKKTPYSESYY